MNRTPSEVVIVGAGPTGLSLALLLARAGVYCTLVERDLGPQAHPAACILSTRTMEIFREIGAAEAIYSGSQSIFEKANITWVTSLAGRELGRISALPDDIASVLALSPVHAVHFPQNRLEPILWRMVLADPLINFMPGHECVAVHQTKSMVFARLKSRSGTTVSISAQYLIACDGAGSSVRQFVGIGQDTRVLLDMLGVYFTANLCELVRERRSILYWTLNPECLGVLIAHMLPDEWVLFVPNFSSQRSADGISEDSGRALVEAAVGFCPKDLSMHLIRPWTVSARLAHHFRRERVFLAGDSAHCFPPTGGLGLNTGVQDAQNLAWKLAAVIKGVAGPDLLATYEAERRPIGKANLEHSLANFENMTALTGIAGLELSRLERLRAFQMSSLFRSLPSRWQRRAGDTAVRLALRKLSVFSVEGEPGDGARMAFAERLRGQLPHYRFLGLDLGVTYEAGALIPEMSQKPEARDPIAEYRPTTWPGARLPHLWVEKAERRLGIHDVLAPDRFAVITGTSGVPGWHSAVAAVKNRLGVPVRCVAIGAGADSDLLDRADAWTILSEVSPCGAVLVRPDGHVAWRSQRLPEAADEVLEAVLRRILSLPKGPAKEGMAGVLI